MGKCSAGTPGCWSCEQVTAWCCGKVFSWDAGMLVLFTAQLLIFATFKNLVVFWKPVLMVIHRKMVSTLRVYSSLPRSLPLSDLSERFWAFCWLYLTKLGLNAYNLNWRAYLVNTQKTVQEQLGVCTLLAAWVADVECRSLEWDWGRRSSSRVWKPQARLDQVATSIDKIVKNIPV